MLQWAVDVHNGPVAIRYGRGGDRSYHDSAFADGSVCCHRTGADVTLVTYGTLVDNAMVAARILEEKGIHATVLRLLMVAPLPVEDVCRLAVPGKPVVMMEETQANACIGEALAYAVGARLNVPVSTINLGEQYVTHGNINQLYAHYGLDGRSVANHVQEVLSNEN